MYSSSWIVITIFTIVYYISWHPIDAATEYQQQQQLHLQQDSFPSIVAGDNDNGSIHITYWVEMFHAFPWLVNTSLLYVTGTISVFLWCSGYVIDYLMDRQEDMAMELAKRRKQPCTFYGATDA
ncbi:hypothetical protein BDA99DRAFT_556236 [Phascolomyces articulosus]|uniref:Uncharacterized protein n=1 Tax=Phascolomyces articulosus TaxID=60185 RepID=A0AAD5K715_9FUNG|nr:hypothetical protein BDA99DRAFT_556236 [Phascolomyces articulosus]